MGGVKRAISIVVCVVLVLAVAACNWMPIETLEPTIMMASPVTTATPTELAAAPTSEPTPLLTPSMQDNTSTPEPEETVLDSEEPAIVPEESKEPEPIPAYDVPDIKKAGLTNDEFYRIHLMLVGISGSCLYDKPIKSLNPADCLIYSFYVLNDLYSANNLPITIIEDQGVNTSISTSDMKSLIESAFGNHFDSSCKSTQDREVEFVDNQYSFYLMEGDPRNRPFVYQIVKTGTDTWRLRFDVVGVHYQYSVYRDKVEATIRKSKNSIYGFTFEGWKVLRNTTKMFNVAVASSSYAAAEGMNFLPKNVLDGNKDTFWLSKTEVVSWLKVSFNKATIMTGFNLDMDYINEHFSEELSVVPSSIIIELSDGTKIEYDDYSLTPGFRSFGREVKIKWIKFIFPAETNETGQPMKAGRYVIDVYAY